MPDTLGFNCNTCHKFHEDSMYIKTHREEKLKHVCDLCGAVHGLWRGHAVLLTAGEVTSTRRTDNEGEPLVVEPEPVMQKPALFPPAETALIPNTMPPVRYGWYGIEFPNGTRPAANWYWDGRFFLPSLDAVSGVSLASIKGWFGLDRDPS